MSNKNLKITYLDGTELPNDGGNEQIIDSESAICEILENNHIEFSDLPCVSADGTYRIERA
jgi:hypothetical protein